MQVHATQAVSRALQPHADGAQWTGYWSGGRGRGGGLGDRCGDCLPWHQLQAVRHLRVQESLVGGLSHGKSRGASRGKSRRGIRRTIVYPMVVEPTRFANAEHGAPSAGQRGASDSHRALRRGLQAHATLYITGHAGGVTPREGTAPVTNVYMSEAARTWGG
jgi:hypothetical protein